MYEYEFVRVELSSGFFKSKSTEEHREIINSYAKKGWRLKQILAPSVAGYGTATYYELIFERKF